MSDVRLVLGVDGGGTKTTAWLAEIDGAGLVTRIAAKGQSGPSNAAVLPFETAAKNVADAMSQTTGQSEADFQQVEAVCLALAGADHQSVADSWRQWLHDQGILNELVTSDVAAVFATGCQEGVGVALIAGTGSIVYGRNSIGATVRIGGWGHRIGDVGSGHWIARQALQAITMAEDRLAPATSLKHAFLEELDVNSVHELVRAVVRLDQSTWASWSRFVFQAAEADLVAEDILNRAIAGLVRDVQAATRQLNIGSAFPLALSGGILVHNKHFRTRLLDQLGQEEMEVNESLVDDPVRGAVILAAHSAIALGKDAKS